MKTYFKSTVGNLYLMIDDEQLKIVVTHSHEVVKGLDVMKNNNSFNRYTSESTDTSKWVQSSEEEFNNTVTQVITSY